MVFPLTSRGITVADPISTTKHVSKTKLSTTLESTSNNDDGLFINTMKSIKDLIAYDYYTSRAVFEHEGNEIVFINNGMIGRVKLYINGEELASRWALISDCSASISCRYDNHTYEVKSRINNLVTMAQKITLLVDKHGVDHKVDPRLAALDPKQLAHFFGGMVVLGIGIGLVLSLFI